MIVHTPIIITILPGKLPSPVREDVLEMLQNQPGIYYIMSYTTLLCITTRYILCHTLHCCALQPGIYYIYMSYTTLLCITTRYILCHTLHCCALQPGIYYVIYYIAVHYYINIVIIIYTVMTLCAFYTLLL